ncbi:MAG TPA: hypothetical protein VGF38_05925 [Ktedonobacterales bacterium]
MGARKRIASAGDGGDGERPGDAPGVPETPETPESPEMTGTARIGFAPIVRVDAPRREIELCATSETVDSHGTIFDYDASKDAFTRWIGNVREMHGRQAVGSRVAVRCDDETRRVYVRIRISRGARDTWEKVLDGTLRGASIGASDVVWQRQRRRVAGEQRSLNVATRYDLVELSLVDNPSNPDALGVTFVRDATPDIALLDVLDELDEPASEVDEPSEQEEQEEQEESAVADVRTPERANQANRARLHGAAQAVLTGCGCTVCVAARALLDDVRLPIERGAVAQADDQPLARALAAGLADNAIHIVALDRRAGCGRAGIGGDDRGVVAADGRRGRRAESEGDGAGESAAGRWPGGAASRQVLRPDGARADRGARRQGEIPRARIARGRGARSTGAGGHRRRVDPPATAWRVSNGVCNQKSPRRRTSWRSGARPFRRGFNRQPVMERIVTSWQVRSICQERQGQP